MPKFITIGYGDQHGYRRTPLGIRKAAHQHDVELQERGAVMGVAGPAVQVRNPENAGLTTQAGPYMTSTLPVAGFALIEASSLSEAVELVAQSPCAVAHGVVEVWPLQEP